MSQPTSHAVSIQADRAEALRALHRGPHPLVLGNAWDAASARMLAKIGFPAVATTSGGIAESLGFADHEQTPAEAMFAATARIAAAVDLPVTADLEAGYGLAPEDVATRAIAAGVVGLNLEDSDYRLGGLADMDGQAARIGAVKDAARRLGVDLVINARIDVYVHRMGPPASWLGEGLRRARAYRAAGADCVYPILLDDEAAIAAFVHDASAPVNIMLRSSTPPLAELAKLGVRRVTVGTGFYRAAMTHLGEHAAQLYAAAMAVLSK